MNTRAIFAISVALSLMSSAAAAKLYVWPWLRAKEQGQALTVLVAPHMFFRFIGLSFPRCWSGFAVATAVLCDSGSIWI